MRREDVINAGDWGNSGRPGQVELHGVHKVQSLVSSL